MADDKTPADSDAVLPAAGASPFFAPEVGDQGPLTTPEPGTEPQSEPDPGTEPQPEADPGTEQQPEPGKQPPADIDLGATAPYDFRRDVDPAAEQYTQLLPRVEQTEIPPFDPAAAQMTQVVPIVAAAEGVPAAPPTPIGLALPTVAAGSRVVIVVSRGAASIPAMAFAAVPHVIGVSQGEALDKLQEAGLSTQVFNECSDLPRGEVIGQLPAFGQSAAAGSEAVLLVSGGPARATTLQVALPTVVGLSEADALSRLQEAGLLPQIVRDFSANVPLGVVVDQLPSGHSVAEEPRKKGSLWWLWALLAVAILVAIGGGIYYYLNRSAAVPNLVGLSQVQAEQAITAAGFQLGSIGTTQTISASEVGKVVSQRPVGNTRLKLIDQVDIVVSGGQKLFAIPDVTGRPQAEARSVLTSAGLQVATNTAYSATAPKDSVISQSPAAGERVPNGTTIGITISLGVQSVTVPGLQNMAVDQARNALKAANLSSVLLSEFTLTGTDKGLVFGQYPTTGQTVAPGTIVGVLVSNGPPTNNSTATVSVPPVAGELRKDAINSLSKVGLSNMIVNQSNTGRPAGEVVGQAPGPSEIVPKKIRVILFVSNGK